uniref:Uncharacterized protein n=1 Tax=Picea sitchensis TaxID=3332 RepID=D5A982_PICSI|nr:unknown [Picea sitchensis]
MGSEPTPWDHCRELFGLGDWNLGYFLHIFIMDNFEHKKFRKVLRIYLVTQANNRDLMLISTTLEEMERARKLHCDNVMAIILLHKQRINSLEVKCNKLCTFVAISQMEALSLASNNLDSGMHGLREDETVSEIRGPMNIQEQSPTHSDGKEISTGQCSTSVS